MREILYKAKRKGWSKLPKEKWWIEGLPVEIKGSWYISTKYDEIDDKTDFGMVQYIIQKSLFEIAPETLCQYIGLKDKDGNRIWENDIVRCNRREKEAKYKVVWDKTYADFRIEKLNGLGIMPICIEEGNTPVFGRHYECIGNIFDNPEMLERN